MPETVYQQPLQVYETRDEAERNLDRYAQLCKALHLTPEYRVKAAPMVKRRYSGTWGVWLVQHR
jgi:hypothetical protein